MRGNGFIEAIKQIKFNLLRQKYHGKFLNLYWRNSRWKLNPKSKNNQTDTSCTKCVVGLCYIFYYFNTTWVICSFFKCKQSTCQDLNMVAFNRNKGRELVFWCNNYFADFNAKRIKSKIDKYKINNNNKSTKHEFQIKYEGY